MNEIHEVSVVDLTRTVRSAAFWENGCGILAFPLLATAVFALSIGQFRVALALVGIGAVTALLAALIFAGPRGVGLGILGVASGVWLFTTRPNAADAVPFLCIVWIAASLLASAGKRQRSDPNTPLVQQLQRQVVENLDTPANRKAKEKWEQLRRDALRNEDVQAGLQGVRAATWIVGALLLPVGGISAFFGPLGAVRNAAKERALQHGARGASELLELDPRPPVLYVRSFGDDALRVGFGRERLEPIMVDALSFAGPVVAIGEPGEKLPPVGAARDYFASNWKLEVAGLMQLAKLIVLVAGTSPGLVWEMETLRRTGLLDRVLFVVPPLPTAVMVSFWREFAEHASLFLALPAVTQIDPARAMVFFAADDERLVVLVSARRSPEAYREALMMAAASKLGSV